MSKTKRFGITKHDFGPYVMFKDHEAAMKEKDAEIAKALERVTRSDAAVLSALEKQGVDSLPGYRAMASRITELEGEVERLKSELELKEFSNG